MTYSWSPRAWKILHDNARNFPSLMYAALEIHGLCKIEKRETLVNLFQERDPNSSQTMLKMFMMTDAVNEVMPFANLANLLLEAELIDSSILRNGNSIFQVILGVKDEAKKFQAVRDLCENFDVKQKDQRGDGIINWLIRGTKTRSVALETFAAIVSFLHKTEHIDLTEKEMVESLTAILAVGGDEDSVLDSIDSIYSCGEAVKKLGPIKEQLLASCQRKNILDVQLCAKIALWMVSSDINPKLLFTPEKTGKSLLFVVLDSGTRGEILFDSVRLLYKAGKLILFSLVSANWIVGASLEAKNVHTQSALKWLLSGPPHAKFSDFGQPKGASSNKSSRSRNRRNFPAIPRVIKSDSPRTPPRRGDPTSFGKARNKIQKSLKMEKLRPQHNFDIKELTKTAGFDTLSYASFVLWAFENDLLELQKWQSLSGMNVVEVCFNSCNQGDEGLFEAVSMMCDDAGFDVHVKGSKGDCFLDWMLSSMGTTPAAFSKFIPWLSNAKGFDMNTKTLDGETLLEAILNSSIIENKLDFLKLIVKGGFNLKTVNGKGESVLDWVLMNTTTGKKSRAIKPTMNAMQSATILSWLSSFESSAFDINGTTVVGHTALEVILDSHDLYSTEDPLKQEEMLYEAVKILIDSDYDLHMRNSNGEGVLDWVVSAVNKERISNLLCARIMSMIHEKRGFDLNTPLEDSNLKPVLQIFVKRWNDNMLQSLVYLGDAGYDLNIHNSKGENVFNWLLEELVWKNVDILDFAKVLAYLADKDVYVTQEPRLRRELMMKMFVHQKQCRNRDSDFLSALKLLCDNCGFDIDETDKNGRVFRTLLENHDAGIVREWARTADCFDLRYRIEDGAPVHQSNTCTVVYAFDVISMEKVAIKIFKDSEKAFKTELETRKILRGDSDETQVSYSSEAEAAKAERKIMKEHQEYSRHVMEFLVDTTDNKEMYLVMKRADRSLFDVINTERFAGRDWKRIQDIARMAASSLQFMNQKQVIHGDFKPRNYMRTDYEANEWKLIDLDASVRHNEPIDPEKCSSAYCPPELAKHLFTYKGERPVAQESYDVWSFGVVLYEMLTGTPLFLRDQTDDALYTNESKADLVNWLSINASRLDRVLSLCEGNITEEIHDTIKYAQQLVRLCLNVDPNKRPDFAEILDHPFFTGEESEKNIGTRIEESISETFSPFVVQSDDEKESKAVEGGLLDEIKQKLVPRMSVASRDSVKSDQSQTPLPDSSLPFAMAAPPNLLQSSNAQDTTAKPVLEKLKKEPATRKGHSSFRLSMRKKKKNYYAKTRSKKIKRSYNVVKPSKDAAPALQVQQNRRTGVVADPKYVLERVRRDIYLDRTHLFLSYMQAQASGTVKDIYYGTSRLGCSSWLDMRAKRLTEKGMLLGIMSSQVFVMILTKDALFRPFCVKELLWAMQFNMDIIFVVEMDSRFDNWKESDFWARWKGKKSNHRNNFEALAEGLGTFESLVVQNHIHGRPERPPNPKHVQVDIAKARLQPDPVRYVLRTSLEQLLKKLTMPKNIIPYRRREYENDAMIQRIMIKAGMTPPQLIKPINPEEERYLPKLAKDFTILVLIPKESKTRSGETMWDFVRPALSNYVDVGDANILEMKPCQDPRKLNDMLPSQVDMVLALMTPGKKFFL